MEISQRGSALTVGQAERCAGGVGAIRSRADAGNGQTTEDTRASADRRDDFYDLLSDNMEITASIFSMLVKRFRQLVQQ